MFSFKYLNKKRDLGHMGYVYIAFQTRYPDYNWLQYVTRIFGVCMEHM